MHDANAREPAHMYNIVCSYEIDTLAPTALFWFLSAGCKAMLPATTCCATAGGKAQGEAERSATACTILPVQYSSGRVLQDWCLVTKCRCGRTSQSLANIRAEHLDWGTQQEGQWSWRGLLHQAPVCIRNSRSRRDGELRLQQIELSVS
jgi:hypothetical protein